MRMKYVIYRIKYKYSIWER